jgi:hypothetical protein
MKGFGGILILFTVLIVSIILLNSIYTAKNEENNTTAIPKIKNFITTYEFNLKNMAYDCNWKKEQPTLQNCLQNGTNLIFEKANLNALFSCTKTQIQMMDINNYYTDINCTNKISIQKNTSFNLHKRIFLTTPKP